MNTDYSVLQTVLKTVYEHDMLKNGDRVLAAVSGGADSVCMLHVLSKLREELNIEIFCAHLNHGLRGEAADSDEEFVSKLCRQLKIKFFSKKVNVAELAAQKKQTVEEAGRNARYEFFAEVCEKHRLNKTATAHNKNDNAETVLMRILRGTGTDGLGGIPHIREDGVIRPLLNVSRAEIEKYCSENALDFCTDATNADNDYTRNKVRNELLPYLAREFNPEIIDGLARLAENVGADARFIGGYAERLYDRLCSPLPNKKPVSLHIDSLKLPDKAIAARVVRIAAGKAVDGVKLEKKHIDDILALMDKQTGAAVDLPQGLRAEVQYGWIIFSDKNEAENREISLADGDEFFEEIMPSQEIFVESIGKKITFKIENPKEYKLKINEIMLDYGLIEGRKLFLRSRRSGDRIVWFPDGRTKKIKNILIDEKIPKKDRNKIPLLCTGDEVVAIVGSRVSGKYKVTKETERALVIAYGDYKQA